MRACLAVDSVFMYQDSTSEWRWPLAKHELSPTRWHFSIPHSSRAWIFHPRFVCHLTPYCDPKAYALNVCLAWHHHPIILLGNVYHSFLRNNFSLISFVIIRQHTTHSIWSWVFVVKTWAKLNDMFALTWCPQSSPFMVLLWRALRPGSLQCRRL